MSNRINALGIGRSSARQTAVEPHSSVRWGLSRQWEVLELADGSVFLDDIFGQHKTLADPKPQVKSLLSLLARADHSFDELADALELEFRQTVSREGLVVALGIFAREGVIVPRDRQGWPRWASESYATRFAPQLDWFSSLDSVVGDGWDEMKRLRDARVTVVGGGGVGSLLAFSLAAAGVGMLRIVDGDVVEASNLTRQIFYDQHDVEGSRSKAHALAARLRAFSPHTEVQVIDRHLSTPEAVSEAVEGSSFVALCADAPRFLLNRWIDDACLMTSTPYLASFVGTVGPMFVPGVSPCFRCTEEEGREMLGEQYDQVVDALAAKASWSYPAFIGGPLAIAYFTSTEIVLQLTQAANPATVGARIQIAYPASWVEPVKRRESCRCGNVSIE